MRSLKFILPYLAILCIAALLTIPAVLAPMKLHDSFWIDWVWADQFTAQLREGVLYPRWLPQSHGGLGSPVFYYYPPLGFYFAGAFGLAGLSTYGSILAAFGAGFALSGIAMYRWLLGWTPRPLFGALLFMAAPYHVLDFYGRGALAEFIAIAFIPLVALGLRRIADGKGPALLALSYAALTAAHLPLALLTSLFFIGPYTLLLARARFAALIPFAAALALGIGLSAIYLVPALGLENHRDAAQLWAQSGLQPHNWSFLAPDWSHGMKVIVGLVTATLAFAALVMAAQARAGWAIYSCAVCALVAGLVPGLWNLPLLESVQFPFRALPLAEFGIATALAAVSWRLFIAPATLFPALILSFYFLTAPAPPSTLPANGITTRYPDVPEHLPPGERPFSWPSEWALDLAVRHRTAVHRDGVTIEPVFYFPAWRIRCGGREVETFPAPGSQLLAYRGAGCERRLGWTWAERLGAFISAVAGVVLVGLHGIRRRKMRKPVPGLPRS